MPASEQKIINRKMQGDFVTNLIRQVKFKRSDFRTIGSFGGFTSLIDLGNLALAFNNDGVGTKTIIAERANRWEPIAIDCVAMNVNDTITVGADPIAMVDYIALKEMDNEVARQLGTGFNVGTQMANVTLVGGETAIVPDLVNHVDVSGAVVGIVQKSQIVTGENIQDGDLIFGLQSSGLHSNGFTTVRDIIDKNEIDLFSQFPGESKKTVDVLLEPTRIYVREVLDIMNIVNIKGMANITGGGIKNIVRMKDMKYVIEDPIEPQNVFKKLMEMGNLSYEQMYEIFNMGIGFVIVIDPESRIDFINAMRNKVQFKEIGHVENGSGIEIPKYGVKLSGYY
ncbi:phosphoribosylaminoimidazole synthetase [Thermogymnomonas acidicola]|uniref:phosphoribosylformylglycinamidine cyclo-ligase n=1 Tax=Thermogymnomonas acidicola TaxID=399579 RepID=A0AA37F999_9ARCH|nr:phosphoribosylformylglycinamidine cyclo-ligase [Thermogymnomonas acidicola]GGM71085.1 phosphoribosylaminoimidazole synthetase [Thermogymnomonas acidicola]